MGQTFFDLGGIFEKKVNRDKISARTRVQGCDACQLEKQCDSAKMEPSGEGLLNLLIVGKAPGRRDDEKGTQFTGDGGELIKDTLDDIDVVLDRDFRKTNAVRCWPSKDKTPNETEVNACRRYVLSEIKEREPVVIVTLGKEAFESVVGWKIHGRARPKGASFEAWAGERIPATIQGVRVHVCPLYNPSYILKKDRDTVLRHNWKQGLKDAVALVRQGRPDEPTWLSQTETTEDPAQAIEWIREAQACGGPVVFDFEASGKKPHRKGHKISFASIAFAHPDWKEARGFGFPFFSDKQFLREWRRFLTGKTKLIAHHMGYEAQWAHELLGYWPKRWTWDTMIAAHCLHNRKPVGLKYLAFVKYGILGMDDDTDRYLTKVKDGENEKDGNAFNRIDEAPRDSLVQYCAEDSLTEYHLYIDQKAALKGHQLRGFRLLMEGREAMNQVQQNGFRVHMEKAQREYDKTEKRIKQLKTKLHGMEEVKGYRGKKAFNPMSPSQISHILYNVQKRKRPAGSQTDEKALKKVGTEFSLAIIRLRKLNKVLSTYVGQYLREAVNGIVHPFYNLHTVKTYRSSADSPNPQNIPARDPVVKKQVRSLIIPESGARIVNYDYKGAEVSIAACVTGDPMLIKYVSDLSLDMHRDQASELFFRDRGDISKSERHCGKNGFVFPEFYGSTAESGVAEELWEMLSAEIKAHLKTIRTKKFPKGISTYKKWMSHVIDVEESFWKRFQTYSNWKNDAWRGYERRGYVDLKTGFRCYGPMKRTEVTNYPVQGPAFHMLLWSLIELMKSTRNLRSYALGQVHDSMMWNVWPEEEKELDRLVLQIGTELVREKWNWIVVPINIEKERSAVDGNWFDMEECGFLTDNLTY